MKDKSSLGKVMSAAITASMVLSPMVYPATAFAAEFNGVDYTSEEQVMNDDSLTEAQKQELIKELRAELANEEQIPTAPEQPADVNEPEIPATEPELPGDGHPAQQEEQAGDTTNNVGKQDGEVVADTPVDTATDDKQDVITDAKDNVDKPASDDSEKKSPAESKEVKTAGEKAVQTAEEPTQSSQSDNVFESASDNSGYVSRHSVNLTTEAFIASIGETSRQLCQDNDLYASVMIAQAILESGSGSSGLSKAPYNNLFGIKGGGTNGRTVNMLTSECDSDGNYYSVNADFAAYDSTKESLEAYVDLLANRNAAFYSGAHKSNTDSYKDACQYLQGRYASSDTYAAALIDIIETYDLTRYDKPLDYKVVGKVFDQELNDYRDMTMDDYTDLLAVATSQLGVDYVWGGTSPETGFDCSGLCQWAYKKAFGIDITRTTYTQQYQGEEVSFDDLRMGDLLFFVNGEGTHHVAMYIGDGFYIQAPQTGDVVKITAMEEYKPDFAKRILKFEDLNAEEEPTPNVAEQSKQVIKSDCELAYRTAASSFLL